MSQRKLPKVVIYLEGGLVRDVVASQDMEVITIDEDVQGKMPNEVSSLVNTDNVGFQALVDRHDVEVSQVETDHYFNQKDREDEEFALHENNARCPECGSDDIVGESFDVVGKVAEQECHCSDCHRHWTAKYTLSDIDLHER